MIGVQSSEKGDPMIGMTGFAAAEETEGDVTVSVRIKSYNNRYLDLKLSLPPQLADAEGDLRRAVQGRVGRGRVELLFTVTENAPADIPVLNEDQAQAYAAVFARLRHFFPDAESPRPDALVRLPGMTGSGSGSADTSLPCRLAVRALARALTAFEAERRREGEATARFLSSRLDIIENRLSVLCSFQSRNEEKLKDLLRSRFREILGDAAECDRFYQELAASLVRFSVSEETERLSVHLTECRRLLTADGPVGKKLDFLAQEINREANTAASKALFVEMTQAVVDIKDALEDFREQLRNVE